NAAFTPGAINTTGETICNGGTPAITIGSTTAASGGDSSITYSWRSSADGYTAAISGAISATYLPPAGLTTTTSYRRYANDGTCNTTPTVSSGTWTVTVNAAFTPGAINTTGETICNGGTPVITIGSTTAASGGDGSITYSWRSSADGYTAAISGATSATYLPPAGLTTTTSYRRYANDGTCNTTPTVSSGTWTVTVNAAFTPGAINTPGETICNGGNPVITIGSATAASGGDSSITYSWRSSADGYTAAISGAISATYLPPAGLTTTTSYRRYAKDGTCNTTPTVSLGTWTVTVDATTVGGTVSSNQTICSGTQPSDLTLSGHTGSVIKWESSLDVSFTSPTDIIVTSTTLTGATIGSLTQDTYFRAVVQNGSCNTEESSSVLITVNDTSVGGSVTGGTAICSGTTSGLLMLSGYTGSIIRWEYSVSPFTSWTTIVNTTTTYTSGTLTQTTQFRAVIQNGVCPEVYSVATSVDINTTTWSSGAWSIGAPDSSTSAVIASSYTSAGNIDACSLTVNNGATVVISSGDTVTLRGSLTANVGSFVTFNNNANLIQSGSTNTNSGAIIIKRNSSFLKRLDYTLWSSPVANQKLKAFSPGTLDTRFYTYNTQTIVSPATAANIYVAVPSPSTTNFDTAKGYLIRVPNTHSTTGAIWTGSFTGVPNNGNYSYTLLDGGAGQRFNLVGNPYPSPIDAVAFVGDINNSSTITGALYFWRKTNNALSPSYCTWTTGGFVTNNEAQVFDPMDVIQTGQGFFVEGTGSGTVNFDNTMRVDNHANQFFRSSNTQSTTSIERNRIWLNATNTGGLFSQTMVGYITNATQGVDAAIDGKYINDGEIALTSLINAVPYAIQGRTLPFDANDIVPLNFKVTMAGNYTIAIDHVDGLFSAGSQSIYLKDNLTTTIHNLNTGAYSFASDAGIFANRFEIVYALPLGTENPIFTANNVVIYSHNDEFVVNTGNIIMSSVKVFDIRGRLIEEKTAINASQTTIKGGLANEVLLVQITSDDGITVTKKVVR
ncbi:T9SS sorting signal type C domain-containing protein, partial [Flavobacterium sp.]|uniref:T9SS sorting signal type C domain-containing protein n=1 Tax=Flavobacterium sp. TaxID=239 RepID=UPI0025E77752